jgi:hypothetical protein
MRDVQWATGTCLWGFPVMGVWRRGAAPGDIAALDRCGRVGVRMGTRAPPGRGPGASGGTLHTQAEGCKVPAYPHPAPRTPRFPRTNPAAALGGSGGGRDPLAGEGALVATAGADGAVRLLNHPCVVEAAPARWVARGPHGRAGAWLLPPTRQGAAAQLPHDQLSIDPSAPFPPPPHPQPTPTLTPREYRGHGPGAAACRFAPTNQWLLSAGGRDRALFQWRVLPDAGGASSDDEPASPVGSLHAPASPAGPPPPLPPTPPLEVGVVPGGPGRAKRRSSAGGRAGGALAAAVSAIRRAAGGPTSRPGPAPPSGGAPVRGGRPSSGGTGGGGGGSGGGPAGGGSSGGGSAFDAGGLGGGHSPRGRAARGIIAPVQARIAYEVTTLTSDGRGAGTDCGVWVSLIGADGESGELPLANHPDNFARGRLDTFVVYAPQVGQGEGRGGATVGEGSASAGVVTIQLCA